MGDIMSASHLVSLFRKIVVDVGAKEECTEKSDGNWGGLLSRLVVNMTF